MARKRADFGKGYQSAGAYYGSVWSSAISTSSLSLLVADTGRLEFQADATEFDIDVPSTDGDFSFIVWAKPISGSVAVNADVMAIGVGGSGAPRWWLTHSLTEAELYFNIVRNDGAGQKEYRIGSVTTDIDPILEDEWFMASCTFDGASSMKVSHN